MNSFFRDVLGQAISDPDVAEWASVTLGQPVWFAETGPFKGKEFLLRWDVADSFKGYAATQGTDLLIVSLTYKVAKEILLDMRHLFLAASFNRPMRVAISEIQVHRKSFAQIRAGSFPFMHAAEKASQKSLQWIFFHEIGHLIESHGSLGVAGRSVSELTGFESFDESCKDDDFPENSEAAWSSHALEIAADYQATRFMMRYLVAQGSVTELDLWCFTIGAMSLYYRFSEHRKPSEFYIAKGTHPSPPVRAKFFLSNVLSLLKLPEYKKRMVIFGGEDRLEAILQHAINMASSYFSMKKNMGPMPPMTASLFSDTGLFAAYYEKIKEVWGPLRSNVLRSPYLLNYTSPMEFED